MTPDQPPWDRDLLLRMQQGLRTYRKLVDNDHMSHQAVGRFLNRTLKDNFDEPFDFLDIGCGDASLAATSLADTSVRRYVGIDLSPLALRAAAGNLRRSPFQVELHGRDFVETLAGGLDPVDVSWISLALHHLPDGGKADFLGSVRAVTRGFLLIYEPTRLEDEDRDAFLERFFDVGRGRWTTLDSGDWERLGHHVRSSDFPEATAGWVAAGREAGFSRVDEVFADPTNLFRMFRFAV